MQSIRQFFLANLPTGRSFFFLKKKELMKPELDKIIDAVERVCRKHNLDYLLDKSGQLVLIYTNPVHDYTDYVLEELGLGNPNDVIR